MRIVWTTGFALFVVSIILLGYINNIRFLSYSGFALTAYGVLTFGHVGLQMIFAYLNRRKISQLRIRALNDPYFDPIGSVITVGFRENLVLYRQHLQSLKSIVDERYMINRRIAVSDGNETEADWKMAEVFSQVFPPPYGLVLPVDFVLWEVDEQESLYGTDSVPWELLQKRQQLFDTLSQSSALYVCILQPHRDKRHAMYTAMQLSAALHYNVLITTDSDTKFTATTIQELLLPFANTKVAAVTGDVKIINIVNWLSLLSSIRYWFAFNLERAAQSYWGVVNCVSGPLGAYRADVVQQIVVPWMRQTFLGERCTFGDDRHLTNLCLKAGWQVLYTPFATCETETPTTVFRWIKQQIRWNKSFYREMALSFLWAHKHPLWLIYDMIYQTLFPLLLLVGIVVQISLSIRLRSIVYPLVFVASIILGGLVKSIYAYILTKDPKKFLFFVYGFLYLVFLLPARIWAGATLWRNHWGTSARGEQTSKRWTTEAVTRGKVGSISGII